MASAKDFVIFDLDRTLTKRPTFSAFLMSMTDEEPGKVLFAIAVLFQMLLYVLKLKTRKSLKEYMLKTYMGGMSRNQTNKAIKKFFNERYYQKRFYQDGLAEIKRHQKEGRVVGVATASMDFYVEAIVRELGLDFMIATTSVWQNGLLVPMIKGENCYGGEKAKRVQAFLAGQKVAKVWFYSDHHTDEPTFELADIKIAVNPGPTLKKIAKRGNYQIRVWK